jgi:hypothetical protein
MVEGLVSKNLEYTWRDVEIGNIHVYPVCRKCNGWFSMTQAGFGMDKANSGVIVYRAGLNENTLM